MVTKGTHSAAVQTKNDGDVSESVRKIMSGMSAAQAEGTAAVTVEESQLSKEAVKFAYKAIDTAYDIQIGKDGIEDTEKKLKGLQGKVGEQVYAVAKRALEDVGQHLNIARGYFLALCKKAEDHIVNKHIKDKSEEKGVSALIPLWAQYKSSIAKGLELGFDPFEIMEDTKDTPKYATAAQYRKAVQEYETRQRATGSQAGQQRQSNGAVVTQLQVVTRGWSEKMSGAVSVLHQELNRLSPEDQDKFADDIIALAAKVHDFAEERLQASMAAGTTDLDGLDPGTKAAMQSAINTMTAEGKPEEGQVVAQELARAARNPTRNKESAKRGGSRAA